MKSNFSRLLHQLAPYGLLPAVLSASACVSLAPVRTPPPAPSSTSADTSDQDLTQLLSILRSDLTRAQERIAAQPAPLATPSAPSVATRTPDLRPLRRVALTSLPMPVMGLSSRDLEDNYGAPRDGGKRKHTGIDIFAPRGREILAVADGYVSYLGEQGKGGRCVWVATEQGMSFYYAHLDHWAAGLYEGMEVHRGTILGYVGTTGNAVNTPPHLHFAVLRDDENVNPYPLLRGTLQITPSSGRDGILAGGFGSGSK